MAKGRYQYYPVIQNPEKAPFNRSFVYINLREWTDPSGKFQPAACKSISPGSNHVYVIDNSPQAEYAKEKLAVLDRAVKGGVFPVIGPYDSIEEAVIAERKVRPLSDKEKLAQADANLVELEALRREVKQNRKNSQ